MSTSSSLDNPIDQYSHHDGFEISFVEPPKELPLKCSICLELLTDPCILDCDCGSNFCKMCIETVKKKRYPCPLCQQQFTTIFPNKQLQRTLNGLTIHCPHKADGCSWMDELGKLKKHLNRMPSSETRLEGCGHTDVLCQYCKTFISRKDIPTHETETCPKKPHTCQYCGHSSVLDDIRENHWLVCPQFPVPCPYECGERPQRQGLKIHVKKKCLLIPVQCNFQYAGCKVEISRRDMANHLKDNVVDHMTLMSIKHREEVSSLKETNKLVQKECADLKGENKRLQSQLTGVNGATQNLTSIMVKLEMQLKHKASAIVPVQPPSSEVPPVRFVVTDAKHLRQQEKEWNSKPFFSKSGYSMVLNVHLCGNKDGYGSHLSVYTYIVKGKYDHLLIWPFFGSVTITLEDQELGNHYTYSLLYTHEQTNGEGGAREQTNGEEGARRYHDTLTSGWGWSKFIELKHLNPNFLKDDCLVFQIDNISFSYDL
ncbi:TNF receptor-associated factor 4-like [Halichondria panicea]|uniref:TNF receptor-associated factor 4-like n=1 Tax=Halichondria panicea TaxID=6063 RepID=UPI00312B5185